MKTKLIFLTAIFCISLLAGCANTATPSPSATVTASPIPSASPSLAVSPIVTPSSDAKTSASIVNTAEAFEKAISKNGTWIIALLNDLTIDKDLSVDGDFMNDKTPPVSQRKLAFYAQDENRVVTARYTLTAPKMTINSIDCSIVNGTFRGDLYVNAKNFQLIGATVDGNVYFTNAEAQSTFKMDADSKITGVQEQK